MPKIYDNIENYLSDGLKNVIDVSKRVDFCVGYFNLRGWHEIADKIDTLEGQTISENGTDIKRQCRLLVGMQKLPQDILLESYYQNEDYMIDNAEMIKLKNQLAKDFKEQLTYGTPSNTDEIYLRKLSHQLKERKVVVKLFLKHLLHAKLYLTYSEDYRVPIVGFLGSSNLTFSGISKQGELNIDVLEQDSANKLSNWFNDRWNDRKCIDITDNLVEIIDNSWATEELIPPYHIYLKIAYHLSREARIGINEFSLPKSFKKALLEFQQKAVLVAAHHLNKRDGVLIGDVVGLGKTITACAVAKIFEEDYFLETLIICPKNLVSMWEEYAHKYQLRAKIISQSQVIAKLSKERRYRIVIIDESHNLRNEEGSRYKAIKDYITRNGSKVILLTATPYNKNYIDLSNQLKLFISNDTDLGIAPENYIESLGGQVYFNARHTETFIRSIKAFEKSEFADDWRELMRLFLVRRTRSFIKSNYAKTDSNNNRKYLEFEDGGRFYFPDRIPKRVDYSFEIDDIDDQYAQLYSEKVVNMINSLSLPRYGLANVLIKNANQQANDTEKKIIQNLSRAGKRLMGFCRTNLFKRLESSAYAFLLSISRHILRNYIFIYAINNNLDLPIGENIINNLDNYLDDQDFDIEDQYNEISFIDNADEYMLRASQIYDEFTLRKKKEFEWVKSALFTCELEVELLNDSKILIDILKLAKDYNPDKDRQLNALYSLINKTHKEDKVLIFTQFSDTAYYLYNQLKNRGIEKIEVVTGDSDDPTSFAKRFSPISNKALNIVNKQNEIRVLITTDVLSEGQNLQDCHVILNYDLPWAIIRLIQRAGRVDRIGQQSEKIICYSFLPEDGLERIIHLRGCLRQRIRQNAEVVGSDETFFEGDPVNLHDLYNEKSGVFDDEDDSEVDLASYAYQIWKNAIDKNPALKKIIPDLPNVAYSTKKHHDSKENGVIVFTRTADENDVLTWMDNEGRIVTQSQLKVLKTIECDESEQALNRSENHHELVKKAVDYVNKEEINYSASLGRKNSIKYKVYMQLERYLSLNSQTLFVTEDMKKALDELFKYPLTEYAQDTLKRQLKIGIQDQDLALLLVALRDEDRLCLMNDNGFKRKHPQIICSIGLK